MNKATVTFLSTIMICFLALPVWGGGMSIWGVGARAKGMGGAYQAIADDWSAAYYNPAGLFYVTENQITFNEVISHYQFKYRPSVTYEGYPIGFYNGNIYNRYKVITTPALGGFMRAPIGGNNVVMGLTLFQPFDANVSWEVFSPLNNDASLPGQQILHNFDAVAVNWVGAFELMEDKLSIGLSAGLLKADLAYGSFFLRPNPANPVEDYYDLIASRPNELITEWTHSSGDGLAPNFRAGILFKPMPDFRFGFSMALPTKLTLEGDSYFYFYMPDIPEFHNRNDVFVFPDAVHNILSSGAVYSVEAVKFETDITLPAQFAAGVAYQFSDRLLFSGGLEYTLWSQFEGYEFKYEFTNTRITRNDTLNQWMTENMVVPADWSNTLRGSLGLEFAYNDMIKLRAGYSLDQSPNSQELDEVLFLHPAFFDTGLKNSIHGGLGLTFENVILDIGAQYVFYPDTYQGANEFLEAGSETGKIITNMAGDYSGSAVETVIQFTVRF